MIEDPHLRLGIFRGVSRVHAWGTVNPRLKSHNIEHLKIISRRDTIAV